MHFYLIGVDYKKAVLEVRENIYQQRNDIYGFCRRLLPGAAAILLTCNRFELYAVARSPDESLDQVKAFCEGFPIFARHAYFKHGKRDVFRHALRVASGLESQLQGETQRLDQLKRWRESVSLPSCLKHLWDEVIYLSQEIREMTHLNDPSVNIASFVYNDIREALGERNGYRIAVIGTGKIAELFAGYRPCNVSLAFLAHKNYRKAQVLSEVSSGEALLLEDLSVVIPEVDALVSATSSPHYIIKKERLSGACDNRDFPLFIYDLAIPRDVDPGIRDLKTVILKDLDGLSNTIQRYNQVRGESLARARDSVEYFTHVDQGVSGAYGGNSRLPA